MAASAPSNPPQSTSQSTPQSTGQNEPQDSGILMAVSNIPLPPKDNQQIFVSQGYSAISNMIYISYYGSTGGMIKLSSSKV